MGAYNNIIYRGVNINIDLCAVSLPDLLSAGMPSHVEVAGGLIEYQSHSMPIDTFAAGHTHTIHNCPVCKTKRKKKLNDKKI